MGNYISSLDMMVDNNIIKHVSEKQVLFFLSGSNIFIIIHNK